MINLIKEIPKIIITAEVNIPLIFFSKSRLISYQILFSLENLECECVENIIQIFFVSNQKSLTGKVMRVQVKGD